MQIIPVGCADRLHRELISHIMQEHSEALLIDIRFVPSEVAPGWGLTALRATYNERYRWFGPGLGDRNHHTDRPFALVNLEKGLLDLQKLLLQGHMLLLMGKGIRYRECPRRLIAIRLAEIWSEFEIVLPEHIQGRHVLLERLRQERQVLEQKLGEPGVPTLSPPRFPR